PASSARWGPSPTGVRAHSPAGPLRPASSARWGPGPTRGRAHSPAGPLRPASSARRGPSPTGGRRALLGLDGADLLEAADVAAPLERGGQEHVEDRQGEGLGDDPGAEGAHVGVVVLAGQAGGELVGAESRPGAVDLVGGYLLPLPAPADHHPGFGPAPHHGAGDGGADRRVVDRLDRVGPEVEDLVAPAGQKGVDRLLEQEAGVVRTDRDAHPQDRSGPSVPSRHRRLCAISVPEVTDCLFCRILAGEVPATEVMSTPTTYAFRDINPQAPTHVLVIPRVHITDAS